MIFHLLSHLSTNLTHPIIHPKYLCICSKPYLAPEMLKDASERLYDSRQSDVWAFGVGVFLSLTRRYPFEDSDDINALKKEQLARKYLEKDRHNRLSPPVRILINACFEIDPNIRPTMDDLCQHFPWLAGAGEVSPTASVSPPVTSSSSLSIADEASRQIPAAPNTTISSNIMQSSLSRTSMSKILRK